MAAADTKTLDKIRSLRREAVNIEGFHAHYSEKYASDSHCDKKGYGFVYGNSDRFVSFKVNATFESYAGYYGNSSCSTILHVYDREAVERAFVKAMNLHQKELFATAARLMREEAAGLTDAAEAELSTLQRLLEQAKAPVEMEPIA